MPDETKDRVFEVYVRVRVLLTWFRLEAKCGAHEPKGPARLLPGRLSLSLRSPALQLCVLLCLVLLAYHDSRPTCMALSPCAHWASNLPACPTSALPPGPLGGLLYS